MAHELSTTFKWKGSWVNVPTVINGVSGYKDTELKKLLNEGVIKPLGMYKTLNEAEVAAYNRSKNYKK